MAMFIIMFNQFNNLGGHLIIPLHILLLLPFILYWSLLVCTLLPPSPISPPNEISTRLSLSLKHL